MIARFEVVIPSGIAVAPEATFSPFEREVDGYTIRIYPPYRSRLDRSALELDSPVPLFEITSQLRPAEPHPATDSVLIEGLPTVLADVLRIDFVGREFDRHSDSDDPPVDLALRIANDFLARLRTLGRGGHVKPLDPRAIWRITYLRDDESEFGPALDEGIVRARNSVRWRVKLLALRPSLWEEAEALDEDFEPTAWDTLLLDALDLLPEIGPVLVLAYTALETRIENALDVLAPRSRLSAEFWAWIRDRGGDWRAQPSVADQLDHLLRELGGRSLKDEPELWQAFRDLHKARNSFVHQGRAVIGDQSVTSERVGQLLALTGTIIDWIEELLPEDERRPRYSREDEKVVQITRMLQNPEAGTTAE
jgi:hypothetical protein